MNGPFGERIFLPADPNCAFGFAKNSLLQYGGKLVFVAAANKMALTVFSEGYYFSLSSVTFFYGGLGDF